MEVVRCRPCFYTKQKWRNCDSYKGCYLWENYDFDRIKQLTKLWNANIHIIISISRLVVFHIMIFIYSTYVGQVWEKLPFSDKASLYLQCFRRNRHRLIFVLEEWQTPARKSSTNTNLSPYDVLMLWVLLWSGKLLAHSIFLMHPHILSKSKTDTMNTVKHMY